MSIEAMKQALKALEDTESYWVQEVCENTPAKIEQSITTLRAAIEQAEKQNPGQVEFDYITDLLWRIDLICVFGETLTETLQRQTWSIGTKSTMRGAQP